jgi:predicted nuclease of predicted toxin-antitoxin system
VRNFLIDNQLPPALSHWLARNGHTASHVLDLKLGQVPDDVIWTFAAKHGYTIVTKDEDFAQMLLLRP